MWTHHGLEPVGIHGQVQLERNMGYTYDVQCLVRFRTRTVPPSAGALGFNGLAQGRGHRLPVESGGFGVQWEWHGCDLRVPHFAASQKASEVFRVRNVRSPPQSRWEKKGPRVLANQLWVDALLLPQQPLPVIFSY